MQSASNASVERHIASALPIAIAVSRAGARRQRTLASNPTVFWNSEVRKGTG